MMMVRGIRGAIRVQENTKQSIFEASKKLLLAMVQENDIAVDEIASIFLTATPDLNADFPAYAARDLGWTYVPLLCAQEMNVPGGMTRLIRILMHVNTPKAQHEIKHQYLGETAQLRPDLTTSTRKDESQSMGDSCEPSPGKTNAVRK
jgi:chorismate mutase